MQDNKKFDYNILTVLIVSILLLLLDSLDIFSPLYSFVNNSLTPIDTKVTETTQNIKTTYESISKFNSLKSQAIDYENEVTDLKSQVVEMNSKIEELEFQLKDSQFTIPDQEFTYLSARVLRVNRNSSEVDIFIAKGRQEGVEVNQNVIYEKYLVGSVVEVFEHNSIVRVVGSGELRIPVITSDTKISGLLEHDQNEGLIISNILPNEVVRQGERIITSGKSGDFVYGLLIGDLGARLSGESESIQRFKVGGYLNVDNSDFVTIIID